MGALRRLFADGLSLALGDLESEKSRTILDVSMAVNDGRNGVLRSILDSANFRTLLRIHRAVVLDYLGLDRNDLSLLSCAVIPAA